MYTFYKEKYLFDFRNVKFVLFSLYNSHRRTKIHRRGEVMENRCE